MKVLISQGAQAKPMAFGTAEGAELGVRTEEEGGSGSGVGSGHGWNRDGCSGWRAPRWRWWGWWSQIQVGSGSVSLVLWPGDAHHVVRETGGTSHI